MKQLFTLLVAGVAALSAGAQAYEGNRFADNWSIGFSGGAVNPLTGNFVKDARGVAGVELTKAFTPAFALGVSTTAGFNTTGSYTAVDNLNTMVLGKFNFSNIFGGYPGYTKARFAKEKVGRPRLFEVVGVVGIGFNHFFGKTDRYAVANDNALSSKFGLDFNFNLGQERAWTLSLRPAVVYSLEGGRLTTPVQYNVNNAVLELTAGVVYHFKSSNGRHHFTYVRPYDQSEVDGLNAKVNDLRAQLNKSEKELRDKERQLRHTQQMLNDARAQKPIVERIVNERQTMESVVTFRQGASTVDASQLPNVERIATYLKNHRSATVIIKGYASPEGSAEINARLAKARAEAVRTILVNKYRIAAERISAEGQGVGNMFSEPDWNRVSICTLEENK